MKQYVKPSLAEIEIDPETIMRRSQFIPIDPGGGGPFDVKEEMDWDDEEEKKKPSSSAIELRDLWNDIW